MSAISRIFQQNPPARFVRAREVRQPAAWACKSAFEESRKRLLKAFEAYAETHPGSAAAEAHYLHACLLTIAAGTART